MNLVFTCGGTGGHINPAIAVAKMFRERQPDCKILFLGADGMERDLVPREGFRLETLRVSSFQRKPTPGNLVHNLKTVLVMADTLRRTRRLLREFGADAVIGTGGYASFPALREGARLGIPTVVHESNAIPGLTTRMVADHVDKIMVSFEACREAYGKNKDKVIVTGTPVREEFLYLSKAEARKKLGWDDTPVVVSCWGSLGAREMNRKIADFMARVHADGGFRHIHATGSYGWRWMPDHVREKGVDWENDPLLDMREYIYDMPTVMAAADVILCRAGAATISEVTASGTPAVIVPSPNVTGHHQEKNAAVLGDCGAAVVLSEDACTGDTLYETVTALLHDEPRRRQMREQLAHLAVVDSTERIYRTVSELTR